MTGEYEEFFSRRGTLPLDMARKISRRLAVGGGSTKTLKEELENQIRKLTEDRDDELTRLAKKERRKLLLKLIRPLYFMPLGWPFSNSRNEEAQGEKLFTLTCGSIIELVRYPQLRVESPDACGD